ncbi:RagB/SusD family nutrient uptake outer membrane protein [Terrimonas pollutisoli]|uniref:RagB/SusD family nutrient uptake outer membrane protein n=1 Tax=Terrimonas pollutisoli TaxID=3034147 RepID=UPI0023EC914B|nr:RagB/SusD family nutrient uptake outer membrane protein [Terrimonas sp. H1YJ31]
MKRIKFIIIIIALVVAVFPLACKKRFLDQTNTFEGTGDATFNKPGDVIAIVNAIYDTYQNSDLLKKCIWYRANFSSHDFFNWGADVFWNNYQIPATFGGVTTFWNQSYIGIARANAALVVIEQTKEKGIIDDALANRLAGEAYFLRGMTYYYLAASFGGVPLELNAVSDGLTPRASRDSVFRQVVADMQLAENLLLSKSALPASELGRATKGAAYGFEGAARMWLKDYAGALAAFNNPELTNNHHLLSSFADVHEYNHQNNDESLFEVQFQLPPNGSQSWDGSWQPPGAELGWIDSFSWPEEITQQGYDYGNPALWNSFQEGDKRKLLTIVGPGDPLLSPGIIAKWGGLKGYIPVVSGFAAGDPKYTGDDGKILNTVGTLTRPWYGNDGGRTGYFCAKKWRDPNLTGNYGPSAIFGDQNQILLRYAEVLLSRAECKVRTGDAAGAMADIKLVRDRAWGGTAPAVMKDSANYDGTPGVAITDPLQMVLSEYRHELTGEYSLFYNLCRAGDDVAIAFIKKANGTVDGSYEPVVNPAPGPTHDNKKHGLYNTTPTVNNLLLPIPQSAIALNPNLTQNPGY